MGHGMADIWQFTLLITTKVRKSVDSISRHN